MKNTIDYLTAIASQFQTKQLCHNANILGKWQEYDKYTHSKQLALKEIILKYHEYLHGNLQLTGYSPEIITQRVAYLNEYYNFYHENGYDNLFSSQGKFRSTILEEFMYLLFKDYVTDLKNKYGDTNDVIGSGAAKAYTNLYFTSGNFRDFVKKPTIGINVKDQDFAIYRDFSISINQIEKKVKIPIVAIENKTYIDKTMLEGIIATAEKIKTGNPYALYISVTENYDVDLSVDPAYSRIDQIFVLRKTKRKEQWTNIDPGVVIKVFQTVQNHIERPWADIETKMRTSGTII